MATSHHSKRNKNSFLIILMMIFGFAYGQNITICGYIYEHGSMETLPGGTIYEPISQRATTTNTYGFYTLTLPYTDSMFVVFNSHGYKNDTLWINDNSDIHYDAHLFKITMLETVTITTQKRITEQAQMSSITLSAKEVKNIPMLLGEKDVFKTLLLMPGVQSGSEGTSGIYVRGGGPDQNLVILDEATIYNANHLLGFFSVFNGDAIKSIELIKGGFPARYGGRLSSVIDISMRDGNKESYHCEGGIGVISSNVTVEGPIVKERSSFMLSGRTTYLDLFLSPIMKLATKGTSGGYYFFDLNGKFNYNISRKDKLYISAYFGRDKFHMSEKDQTERWNMKLNAGLFWQNSTATARWNHLFNNRTFSNMSFIFSDYTLKTSTKYHFEDYEDDYQERINAIFNSGIRDYTLKYDVSYNPNSTHKILAGAALTYHEARPSANMFQIDTTILQSTNKEIGLEYAVYIEDEINIRNRFRINPGFRIVAFSVPHKTYVSPEPRLSLSYNLLKNMALKASYAMMSQSIILLSTSTIGLPTDLWVPVTENVLPQRSQQVALGLHYDLKEPCLSFSLEGYYKRMNNILAYREGASYLEDLIDGLFSGTTSSTDDDFHNKWSQNITSGNGWSTGMELLVRKEIGKFTGWIGYTLSWTKQQFDELNFGKPFYARYDRRHDISIVLMYSPTPHITLSMAWVFATGNAVTLPNTLYPAMDLSNLLSCYEEDLNFHSIWMYSSLIENYGEKNNFRMKPFHHLDIGVQFIKPHKKNKGQSIFEISIYNVYNHKNPFFYYITTQMYNGQMEQVLRQISIFPIIPTFVYHFKF